MQVSFLTGFTVYMFPLFSNLHLYVDRDVFCQHGAGGDFVVS